MGELNCPFKPGQDVEGRSFAKGYRGAWFPCKIKKIRMRGHYLLAETEYYNFPDQSVTWEKVYRKKSRSKEPNLMFRPKYPSFFHEDQVPDTSSISGEAVIANTPWQEGDLVDWFADGCYWSGKLTQVLGDDKFKLELFPAPEGEGLTYEVLGKDLRPSLDWSPEHGWTLPKAVGKNSRSSCARLVKISNQGAEVNSNLQNADDATNNPSASGLSNTSADYSLASDISEKASKRPLSSNSFMEEEQLEADKGHSTVSSLHEGNASTKSTENRGDPSKKMRTDKTLQRNTMSSDSIEAAILDLVELENRVKWIKGMLEFGAPSGNSVHPSWKFVEPEAKSLQK